MRKRTDQGDDQDEACHLSGSLSLLVLPGGEDERAAILVTVHFSLDLLHLDDGVRTQTDEGQSGHYR